MCYRDGRGVVDSAQMRDVQVAALVRVIQRYDIMLMMEIRDASSECYRDRSGALGWPKVGFPRHGCVGAVERHQQRHQYVQPAAKPAPG